MDMWISLEAAANWFDFGTNIEDWKREAVAKKLREMADEERKRIAVSSPPPQEPVGLADL